MDELEKTIRASLDMYGIGLEGFWNPKIESTWSETRFNASRLCRMAQRTTSVVSYQNQKLLPYKNKKVLCP